MTPDFSRGADGVQPLVFVAANDIARTPAGITFRRLAQASGFALTDRLLVVGVLSAVSLAGLVASGARNVTVVRPDQRCPSHAQADVVWLLDVRDAAMIASRLQTLARRLAADARLVIELSSVEAIRQAEAVAALLRSVGLHTVRVEQLHPGAALVRGRAPSVHQQAA